MTDGRKENCVAESEHFEGSCIYISKHCRVSIYSVKNKRMTTNKVLPLSHWSEFSPKSTTTSTVYTIKLSFQVPTCNITLKTHRTT